MLFFIYVGPHGMILKLDIQKQTLLKNVCFSNYFSNYALTAVLL